MARTLDPVVYAVRSRGVPGCGAGPHPDPRLPPDERCRRPRGARRVEGRLLPLLRIQGRPARRRRGADGRPGDRPARPDAGRPGAASRRQARGAVRRHGRVQGRAEGPRPRDPPGLALGRQRDRPGEDAALVASRLVPWLERIVRQGIAEGVFSSRQPDHLARVLATLDPGDERARQRAVGRPAVGHGHVRGGRADIRRLPGGVRADRRRASRLAEVPRRANPASSGSADIRRTPKGAP